MKPLNYPAIVILTMFLVLSVSIEANAQQAEDQPVVAEQKVIQDTNNWLTLESELPDYCECHANWFFDYNSNFRCLVPVTWSVAHQKDKRGDKLTLTDPEQSRTTVDIRYSKLGEKTPAELIQERFEAAKESGKSVLTETVNTVKGSRNYQWHFFAYNDGKSVFPIYATQSNGFLIEVEGRCHAFSYLELVSVLDSLSLDDDSRAFRKRLKLKSTKVEASNGSPELVLEQYSSDGVASGLSVVKTTRGDTYEVSTFVDGIQEGKYLVFYPNGRALIRKWFYFGKGVGVFMIFWDNGNLKTVCQMDNDQLVGIYTNYYRNGKLMSTTPFEGGKEHGRSKKYLPDGRCYGETLFSEGEEGKNTVLIDFGRSTYDEIVALGINETTTPQTAWKRY